MGKGKVKIFKDSVHGYIEIPSVIVANIIDTKQFQRLRFIEQTSMRSLYPSARHDRFIHSLGVYYLGRKVFAGFRDNCLGVIASLKERIPEYDFGYILDEKWWKKQRLLFEIACLMHDCAHAPFSHTLEDYYLLKKNSEGVPKLNELLESECDGLDESFKKDFEFFGETNGIGAAHERLSSYIILHEYKQQIINIFKSILPDEKLDDEDFVFICRMIIGCRYKQNDNITNSLKNCIISLLNSSTIDVDGLDYIVRDAQMSGASTFNIDYQRIINSFTILPTVRFDDKNNSEQDIGGIWLKDSHFEINYFDGSIRGEVRLSDSKGTSTPEMEKLIPCEDGAAKTESIFSTVNFDKSKCKGVTVHLMSSAKVKYGTKFRGKASGYKIVNTTDSLEGRELSFVLGYDKRCLSIIQNTIDARNNEYLWIYTHPKVLYNSHYLQSELLLGAARFLCFKQKEKAEIKCGCPNCFECKADTEKNISFYEDYILQILGYEEFFDTTDIEVKDSLMEQSYYFYRSNDDDLNALFKRVYLNISNMGNPERFNTYQQVYDEYASRKQRKTMWKSFMEKEVISDNFQGGADGEDGIGELIERARKASKTKIKSYSKLSDEEQAVFSKYGLENVLIICAKAKTKKIDFPEFFVKYGDTCARLCDVFDSNMATNSVQKDIEYIFYEGDEVETHKYADLDKELGRLYGSEQ